MECKEIKLNLLEYLEGRLDAPKRIEFEKHCTGCPGCATDLKTVQIVT